MSLFLELRLIWSALFGPNLPKIQVDYCNELDHMVILVGDGMPTVRELMQTPVNLGGVTVILELYSSNDDLFSICERIVTGVPIGTGDCLVVNTQGAEGERIAQAMREDPVFGFRLYLAILREVQKFRLRPGFAGRAQYWRTVREAQKAAFVSMLRFAPDGFDDGNVEFFVLIDPDGDVPIDVTFASVDDDR